MDIDCLSKWIDGMSPTDPDDREEFSALKEMWAENNVKIKTLYDEQMRIIEELIALSQDAPAAA